MNHRCIFNEWLNSSLLTEEERQEIKGYTDSQIEKLFSYKPLTFGTSGIRRATGIAPQLLNRFTYRLLTVGFGEYLLSRYKNPSVLIAHDNRKYGDKYALTVAKALKNLGIEVFLVPNNSVLPTPILSYYIRRLGLSGGMNITASHNPPLDNGFKLYNHTGKLINKEEESEVSAFFPHLSESLSKDPDTEYSFKYLPDNYLEEYLDTLKEHLPILNTENKDVRVLFSSHHGTSSGIMEKFAHSLGFLNFKEFRDECTPTWELNEGEIANPEEIDSFSESISYAKNNDYEYVCAHDPDGDRAAIVEKQRDGSWYFFNGNEIGVLISHFKNKWMSREKYYIVTTHVTSTYIKRLFPEIPIHLTQTGFKNISEVVNKEEDKGNTLLIAFEEAAGALIFPFHREKDGYQQILVLLEVISIQRKNNRNLKDYLNVLLKEYGYWKGFTDFYRVKFEDYLEYLRDFKDLSSVCEYQIDKIKWDSDNEILIWYLDRDSWIKFRSSGTEIKMKVYFCLFGDSETWLERQTSRLRLFFEELLKSN